MAALAIIEREPERRERLWKNRERFAAGLRSIGISIGNSDTPIVPLIIGDPEMTLKTGTRLFDEGVYATAIRPPTVAENTSRIRMTLMATHTDADIDAVIAVLGALKREGFFP
jgi:7-keto-8-aminopelargonate synthetase-like enzyme